MPFTFTHQHSVPCLGSGERYAPMYRESALDDAALAPVRRALDFMLAQQEPFPALVVNANWDMLLSN